MNFQTYIPSKALSPFVKNYLIIDAQQEQLNKVLPETHLVMAFRYKGRVDQLINNVTHTLAPAVISGLRKSERLLKYTENTGNLLVLFKEAGASAFFREPLHELFQESISLDNFIPTQDVADLEDQLAEASHHKQRINLVEQFLLSRLCHPKTDPLITVALERIQATKGIIKIKDLTNSLCISQDAFEKRFRRAVGASPKQYAYIIRMKSVLFNIKKKQKLTDVAFDAGYFDQSHFNKDFKLFTGQSPTAFLESPVFW